MKSGPRSCNNSLMNANRIAMRNVVTKKEHILRVARCEGGAAVEEQRGRRRRTARSVFLKKRRTAPPSLGEMVRGTRAVSPFYSCGLLKFQLFRCAELLYECCSHGQGVGGWGCGCGCGCSCIQPKAWRDSYMLDSVCGSLLPSPSPSPPSPLVRSLSRGPKTEEGAVSKSLDQ